MFGKKQKKTMPASPPAALEQTKFNEHDVHVMPGKFLPERVGDSSSPVKKIALILTIVVVFLGAGIAGAVWYLNKNVNQNTNTNTNANTNTNTNTNQNININTNTNNNTNTNTNINTNTNNNQNTNTNINTNTNTNTNTAPIDSASDTDGDSLTQEEEFLFKTNLSRADTDKDGYRDGLEVASLYDPLVPNQALVDSGLVTKYNSAQFGFSVLRPKDWLSQAMDENVNKVMFLPDSETGEFFSLEAMPNDQNLTLAAYQATLSGGFENFSLDGTSAIRSADGFKVYAVYGDYIYAIIYETSDLEAANFKTTFNMILKSFAWEQING